MGEWGGGLYQNDTALDVRDEYKSLILKDIEEPNASEMLFKNLGYDFTTKEIDDYDTALVWLALADTQHKLGRINETVRSKALQLIDSGKVIELLKPLLESYTEGKDLNKEDANLIKQKQKVLSKLHETLSSPTKEPKKLSRKRFSIDDGYNWNLGEVYSYIGANSKPILLLPFKLEDFPEFFEGSERIKIPVFYMIEWEKNIPPNENELSKAALKKFPQDFLSSQPLVVHIYAKKVSEFPSSKIKPLSIRYKNLPKPNLLTRALGKVMPREAYYTLQWKIFEDWLDGKHHEGITMS